MITKAISILVFVLSVFAVKASAADTLVIIFDRQNFVQGDSIEMEVYTDPYRADQPAQTLHLWIDNIKTGQRWKFRYPFLKGRYRFSLKINDSIPNGTYAFNFLLQKEFLIINGKLLNATEQDKSVNFLAKAKNKPPIIDGADLHPGGYFKIDNLYYTDSVLFGFSPVQKTKANPLRIAIETPVDSVFVPEAIQTEYITVGIDETKAVLETAARRDYVFSVAGKNDEKLLKELVLTTKERSRRKKYEEQNVSGLFASDNSTTFDLGDSNEQNTSSDIYSYLLSKVPGLRVETNPENGQPVLYWRNDKTDIYVNEFVDTDFSPYGISMQDIELIKIYPPGTRTGLDGSGGTIAIYTKRSVNRSGNKIGNYSFYVKGYTKKNAEWK